MVNNVVLVGRITKDPELRHVTNGSSVCNFSLAINRTFKNQSGEYDADFINCVAFNQTANLMEQYVAKGQLLSVQGRLQSRSYEDNTGRRIYVTEVVANNVSFLESRRNVAAGDNTYSQQNNFDNSVNNSTPTFDAADVDVSIDDDDLPF